MGVPESVRVSQPLTGITDRLKVPQEQHFDLSPHVLPVADIHRAIPPEVIRSRGAHSFNQAGYLFQISHAASVASILSVIDLADDQCGLLTKLSARAVMNGAGATVGYDLELRPRTVGTISVVGRSARSDTNAALESIYEFTGCLWIPPGARFGIRSQYAGAVNAYDDDIGFMLLGYPARYYPGGC